jgi:hypothetical protein
MLVSPSREASIEGSAHCLLAHSSTSLYLSLYAEADSRVNAVIVYCSLGTSAIQRT